MSKEEKDKGFKVTDKRLFSPDGTSKEGEEEISPLKDQEEASPPEEKEKPSLKDRILGKKEEEEEPQLRKELEEINFSQFIFSLGSSALIQLGEIPHPATQKKEVDLEGGKQTIDILGILKEKTQGNLSREEDVLLDSLLSDLRFKYVEAVKNKG